MFTNAFCTTTCKQNVGIYKPYFKLEYNCLHLNLKLVDMHCRWHTKNFPKSVFRKCLNIKVAWAEKETLTHPDEKDTCVTPCTLRTTRHTQNVLCTHKNICT